MKNEDSDRDHEAEVSEVEKIALPIGWIAVPMIPTANMLDEGAEAGGFDFHEEKDNTFAIYQAMIIAARRLEVRVTRKFH